MFVAYAVYNKITDEYETNLLGEPDEFAYFKNNGAYINAGIKRLIGDIAPTAARILNQPIPHNWSDIANRMRIPVVPNNITLKFDGMQGDWAVKQASVVLMNYPLGYRVSEEHALNDMEYYSVVNTRDGPAMTWSIYAISEAQLQESGCASYTYLLRSAAPYLRRLFYQFCETAIDAPEDDNDSNPVFPFGLYPAFPFLTGAGGFLQVFTHGLTGMRRHHNYLYLDPILSPQIPQGVRIKGIKWQGASFDTSIQLNITTIT
ncbi:hypothetical protein VTN49DRAFT_2169 [Thermomyces lanuginosus]|uniref:uncharacterized protein n=1 Tax=Thermomyces lanuginosus TaxID=5541 RepID=UPI003744B09D